MEFLNTLYYGNTLAQWLIALLIIGGTFIGGRIVYWFFGRVIKALASRTKTDWDDLLVDMAEEPVVAVLVLLGVRYALGTLTFDASAQQFIQNAYVFIIAVIIAWGVMRLYDAFHTRYLQKWVSQTKTDLDDQLLPIIKSTVRFIVLALGILIGLNNAGYDVGAVLAGLGIGGLAFALAAQDTVANIFGGVTIFIQRPFKPGDRISVAGTEGYVRTIGLRSSMLETISGEKIYLPNKYFIDSAMKNLDVASFYYDEIVFQLHRDITTPQLETIIALLNRMGEGNELLAWVDTYYTKPTDYSHQVTLAFGVKQWSPDDKPYFAHFHKIAVARSRLALASLKAFEQHNIKLASPVLMMGTIPAETSESQA